MSVKIDSICFHSRNMIVHFIIRFGKLVQLKFSNHKQQTMCDSQQELKLFKENTNKNTFTVRNGIFIEKFFCLLLFLLDIGWTPSAPFPILIYNLTNLSIHKRRIFSLQFHLCFDTPVARTFTLILTLFPLSCEMEGVYIKRIGNF